MSAKVLFWTKVSGVHRKFLSHLSLWCVNSSVDLETFSTSNVCVTNGIYHLTSYTAASSAALEVAV